jgi:sugar phosphate isomerase/epimerase
MKTSSPVLPKLGCTAAYVFAYRNIKMTIDDYMDAIETVGRLGFTALDLEILEDTHIAIYTPRRIRLLREQAARHRVQLCGFTPWNAQKYLYSLDPSRRRLGFKLFDQECRITRDLGITEVHLGSDIPVELVKSRHGEYKGAPPSGIRLDKLAWEQVWRLTVNTYKTANRIALKYGLRFGIEPRANSVIWSADSFLRLREAVGPNCGCVWDPMHAAYHREDSAWAIRKLGSTLLSLQLCDADGETMFHRKLGTGIVDLAAIKQALKDIRYRGTVLLELYASGKETKAAVDRYYRTSKIYWENL